MKSIVKVTTKPVVKGSLVTISGVIFLTAGWVLMAEGVLRWLDSRYSILEDWDD